MAAAVAIPPPLAPRPLPRVLAAWTHPPHLEGQQTSPALKQLHSHTSTTFSRARRERPCDGCRRRKSKCVLQESRRCVLCEFHKQDCTFVENAQPRKRKAEGSPRSEAPPKRSPRVSRPPSATPEPSKIAESALRSPAPTLMHPSPRQRQDSIVVDSLGLRSHHHSRYLGPTTALDASLIGLTAADERQEFRTSMGSLRSVTDWDYFITAADSDVRVPDDEVRALAEVEETVGPHGPALIEMFFRIVHPSYPILRKEAFLQRHRSGEERVSPALLAAMYLLALGWWDQEPAVSTQPKPDIPRLEYLAITTLTIAIQRPKLSAIQAGLLLLQRAKSNTWTLSVQLVALGQDLGLHLDCSGWSIPAWEGSLRKRLAWALYMQDKWSAVMHGRPSHINAADWNVAALTADDFETEEGSDPLLTPRTEETPDDHLDHGRTCFMQMIALTGIMAEVCDTFYSATAKAEYAQAGPYASQLVLNRAKPVQIKLKDWFARLPAECKMDSSSSDAADEPRTFAQQGHLHLAYFATEISIHRRIVQALADAPAPGPPPYMLFICRAAAKTRLISALDFVNRLRPAHLHAFWFFAAPFHFALIGTFGALLQATSPGAEEAWFYACRLNEFRWTLGVSARQAPWIAGALEALEVNAEMLKGLPEKPPAESIAMERPQGGAGAGEARPMPTRMDSVASLATGDIEEEEEDGGEDEWEQ